MATPISSIINKAIKKSGDKLNCLTFPTHERYEGNLAKSNCNFYAVGGPGIKDWNKKYGPIPQNYTIFDKNLGDSQIPLDIDFDFVLSQSRHAHFGLAQNLSNQLHLPLVTLEHCIPHPSWNKKYLDIFKDKIGDLNIYITDFSIEAWGFEKNEKHISIYHGIDTDLFSPSDVIRINNVLCVCNDMIGRPLEVGWPIFQTIANQLPNQIKLVGDNGKFSQAPDSVEALVKEYQMAWLFLNTTTSSTIPTSMLEAMACGCVPITTGTGAISEFIQHGENGLIYNTPEEAVRFITDLLKDKNMIAYLSENARHTIVTKYNLSRFVQDWNNILDNQIRPLFYKGLQ